MTVELKEDLCENKTTEFIWRCEESMCVRFFQFATHDEFVICVWKRDDSESRDESEKIFDVNKKYSERISKSSSIARALNTKKTTHEAFVTLQDKISDEKTTDQKKSEKFSNRKFENRKYDDRSCLCEKKHSFNDCFYLIENIRSIEWKSNEEIMKKIEKILETNSRIKTAIKYVRRNVKKRLKKKVLIYWHSYGYVDTMLRLRWHHAPVTLTLANQIRTKVARSSLILHARCTRNALKVLQHKSFVDLLSWSSAFDLYKDDPKRAIFDVGYQAWNESFLKLFEILMFFDERALKKKVS
jgi:hypothetical protein